MIKHIVLFGLKPFVTEQEKKDKLVELKTALLSLKGKVEVLRSIEVGINANPAEKYDIALLTTFDSMHDLEIYAKHPEHVAVGAKVRAVLEERACVDFEC